MPNRTSYKFEVTCLGNWVAQEFYAIDILRAVKFYRALHVNNYCKYLVTNDNFGKYKVIFTSGNTTRIYKLRG